MAGVKFDGKGIDKAATMARTLANRFDNMRPFLRRSAQFLQGDIVKKGLTAGVSPDGTPFAPLDYYTVLYRKKRSDKPLIDTGALRKSVFARSLQSDNAILFGNTGAPARYAPTHQFGDPSRNIPARPFLPVLPDGTPYFPEKHWPGEWLRRTKRRLNTWIKGGKLR